ncbi:SPOR domain-containing protein [Maricurvus nonylphenolicus]|uniref:SPOR domain-containing protein n=1 Tax=Maricurvus nonylphenolicus TaxID=1008307 RepID=UPI0036F35059
MSKDFAKKPKKQAPPPKPKSQVPGWVWLFTGTVLGAFIMFLAHLSGITPAVEQPAKTVAKAEPKPEKTIPKPRFDFYKLLKESEVPVPEVDNTAPTNAPVDNLEYILQVGSFKRAADADRLRAELILMNLDTQIEKVTVRNGEVWHRVLVGPFQNRSKLAQARSTLVSNDINPLLLKRKAG